MMVRHGYAYGNRDPQSLEDFLQSHLRTSGGGGVLEDTDAQATANRQLLARLVALLVEKGLLSLSEVEDITELPIEEVE